MKTKEPQYVADTLKWCNERRKVMGKEPLTKLPKGIRNNGYSCPCGKATGLYVGENYYCPDLAGNPAIKISNPKAVVAFVFAFDRGQLPQYEE